MLSVWGKCDRHALGCCALLNIEIKMLQKSKAKTDFKKQTRKNSLHIARVLAINFRQFLLFLNVFVVLIETRSQDVADAAAAVRCNRHPNDVITAHV